MDERAALALLEDRLDPVGDDAAVVDDLVVTTDMLHEKTDFPAGTTRYTAGWRSVGASLSDVAAMGARAKAAVAAYAAPTFDADELEAYVRGARDVCAAVGGEYVGGDLDTHEEFTVATTAVGETSDPVFRSGAQPGNVVCVTGTLGRSAAALDRFEAGDHERANALFRFEPRIRAGRRLAPEATAMMDSSDGLARSLHQLAAASGCGFAIERDPIPIDPALEVAVETTPETGDGTFRDAVLKRGVTFGEDFELVCTMPEDAVSRVRASLECSLSVVGRVLEADAGITLDGEDLPDQGYTHGE
ncbi:thiamine-phosphate kinase [Natrialbaceae archaeon A-chndr2]